MIRDHTGTCVVSCSSNLPAIIVEAYAVRIALSLNRKEGPGQSVLATRFNVSQVRGRIALSADRLSKI